MIDFSRPERLQVLIENLTFDQRRKFCTYFISRAITNARDHGVILDTWYHERMFYKHLYWVMEAVNAAITVAVEIQIIRTWNPEERYSHAAALHRALADVVISINHVETIEVCNRHNKIESCTWENGIAEIENLITYIEKMPKEESA